MQAWSESQKLIRDARGLDLFAVTDEIQIRATTSDLSRGA